MTTYTYSYTYTTPRSTSIDWLDETYSLDHWSDIIQTPTHSTTTADNQFPEHLHLENSDLNKEKYNQQEQISWDRMEESWRNYPLPSSPLTDLSSGIAPHGIGGHRRGPSELESTILWDTSQSNGELGLAPHLQMEADMKAGFPDSFPIPVQSSKKVSSSNSSSNSSSSAVPISQLPLPIAVWATMMDSSKGRDKVLKCVQYTLRTYLYLLGIIAAVRPLTPWLRSNNVRMKLAVSSLSLTRKCLLLLNTLHPLTHLLSPTPTSAPAILRHLIDLSSALADDAFTLSRLGIVSRRKGRVADRWANRFWFLTTLLGMWTVYTRTIPSLRRRSLESRLDPDLVGGMRKERKDVRWTAYKLWSDLVFVSYDVFNLTWFKEPVQCAAGLCSAVISTSKIYDQYWLASASASSSKAIT